MENIDDEQSNETTGNDGSGEDRQGEHIGSEWL